jgi:trans-2,3-dihydro-3-hydroxyanthranilate isomerase
MNRRNFLFNSALALAASPSRVLASWPDLSSPNKNAVPTPTLKEAPMHIPFSFVDVFAEQPLTGNPLAIIPDADQLDDATMLRIAAELNQAETTFILKPTHSSADWRLRSLTAAGHEVFGAGHNSLGAWWWLAETGKLSLHEGRNRFTQQIGSALLPVEVERKAQQLTAVILTQSSPIFGNICLDHVGLALSLGLATQDLSSQLPAQVVSTGAGHLLVPVRDRSVIARAHPDPQRLARLLKSVGGEGCYLFSLDPVSPSSIAHARFFNPTVGLAEDAATGTAAGPLACQLVTHGIAHDGATMLIEQGYEMNRPSLLSLQVHGATVQLAGRCVKVIDGTIRIR